MIPQISPSMSDQLEKQKQGLKISAGLLVGYVLAALINKLAFDKTWEEAFGQKELIMGIAGIALSLLIYLRTQKRKEKDFD